MLSESDFIREVFGIAKEQGYKIEINARNNLDQIDFGHKKLHKGHLEKLYPAILKSDVSIAKLIEEVAPGRPCTHKPMREIVSKLQMTEKSMPIWQRIQKCAEQLTESGYTPFTRGDLIKCIQKDNPECGVGSINPIIQGVTDNLKGGAGGIGKNILHSVERGQFILNSNQEFPSSRPNKKHMPIWQHIKKCVKQLIKIGWALFLVAVKKKVSEEHSIAVKKKVSKKPSIKLNGKSLELGGYKFYLICKIKLELDEQGSIKEYFPQNRYDNSKGLSLHKYGKGPFCKFKIESEGAIDILGVYVLAVNDTPKYVGECENLYRRFNYGGYGNIAPRACFDGGQSTNCRINHLILSEVKKGASVELYFYPTEKFKQIEWSIRSTMRLDWNKR